MLSKILLLVTILFFPHPFLWPYCLRLLLWMCCSPLTHLHIIHFVLSLPRSPHSSLSRCIYCISFFYPLYSLLIVVASILFCQSSYFILITLSGWSDSWPRVSVYIYLFVCLYGFITLFTCAVCSLPLGYLWVWHTWWVFNYMCI